ncbi:putative membrane protein YesL [Isoptericola jiangsuensis]|uniref:Putative membrane protein YesL n=1 Tax=Isoptericola jiangsuensis TaxID=548579 RepID=A0A2A9EZK0_9MICO|nr:YesL family protein [Isoptericola jiangsuensis]PFG43971.1 putative membrane protein YesL [Isoptericola jiangsuensis]
MRIDPDGRQVQGISTFVLFVVLNVLYLVTCLPVVTVGAATSALLEVTLRYADEERGDLVRGYLRALRTNLWRGTGVLLALGVPTLMLVFSAVFWLNLGGLLTAVAGALSVLAATFGFAATLYGFALVAWFDAPLRRCLRNALLLPLVEPARTLGLVLLPVTGACVVYLVPVTGFLAATIGLSFGAYLLALLLHGVFRRRRADPSELEPVSPHSGE